MADQKRELKDEDFKRIADYMKEKGRFTLGNVQKNVDPQPHWEILAKARAKLEKVGKVKLLAETDSGTIYEWVGE